MSDVAKKNNCVIKFSRPDQITDADMEGFSYLEHKENVALALDVCLGFGVTKEVALPGMHASLPDEGVLRMVSIKEGQKRIHFFNALAANDPESSLILWNSIVAKCDENEFKIIVLNSRKDRQERAVQLVEMIAGLEYDRLVLIGENMEAVRGMCLTNGIPKNKVVGLGQKPTEEQYKQLVEVSDQNSTIVAFGNMGAGGAELSKMFENMHELQLKTEQV